VGLALAGCPARHRPRSVIRPQTAAKAWCGPRTPATTRASATRPRANAPRLPRRTARLARIRTLYRRRRLCERRVPGTPFVCEALVTATTRVRFRHRRMPGPQGRRLRLRRRQRLHQLDGCVFGVSGAPRHLRSARRLPRPRHLQPGHGHLLEPGKRRRFRLRRRRSVHEGGRLSVRSVREQHARLLFPWTTVTIQAPAIPPPACTNPPKADGAACDDGNPCSTLTPVGGHRTGATLSRPASDACHEAGAATPPPASAAAPKPTAGLQRRQRLHPRDACRGGMCTGAAPSSAPRPTTATCPAPATSRLARARTPPRRTAVFATTATLRTDRCLRARAGRKSGGVHRHRSTTPARATQRPALFQPAKPNGTTCSDSACLRGTGARVAPVPGAAVTCAASDQCHAVGTNAGTRLLESGQGPGARATLQPARRRARWCRHLRRWRPRQLRVHGPVPHERHLQPGPGAVLGRRGPTHVLHRRPRLRRGTRRAPGYCAASSCFADPLDRCTLTALDSKTGFVSRRGLPGRLPRPRHRRAQPVPRPRRHGGRARRPPAASQTSCARTGCVPSTGVCSIARACAPVDCHTYACEPAPAPARPGRMPTPGVHVRGRRVRQHSLRRRDLHPTGVPELRRVVTRRLRGLEPDTCHVVRFGARWL
jgi:hypothetical protein